MLWAALAAAAVLPRSALAQSFYAESQAYPVTAFVIEYPLDSPGQPDPAELLDLEVELRETATGLLAPNPLAPSTRIRLSALPPGAKFHPGALRAVNRAIVDEFARRGIGGVLVTIPDLDEESARDLRPVSETRLRLRVWVGRVENVATVADGERYEDESIEARTNRSEHAWIREGSPVQAGGQGALLRPGAIDEYSAFLSRHPGRRVNPTLQPGALPGTSRLEYHVAEQKPWLAYAQISNTGTDATTLWRERFGFSHNQLTGRDDILRLDYVTGDFDSVHGVYGEYGGPLFRVPRVRWKIDGSWSQYDASEVGVSSLDFSGETWEVGGRLQANLFQRGDFFLDAFAGLHWDRIGVDNDGVGEESDDFFLPEAGLYAERVGEVWTFDFETAVTHNVSSVADTNRELAVQDELFRLGGNEPASADFTLLKWQGGLSLYVPPLLNRFGWSKEADLGSYDFAHELAFTTLGQVSFGKHLVPQLQQIAGGLYTLRGYDQAAVAGDTVAIMSAEYRLHVPRLFDTGPPLPMPWISRFRYRPENAFAFPDWDFIVRAFVDAAKVVENGRCSVCPAGENSVAREELLHSFGAGVELRVLRNLSARLDVAWGQEPVDQHEPHLDKPEIHGVVTLLY
jgi:hemolysin activation/secretion protein